MQFIMVGNSRSTLNTKVERRRLPLDYVSCTFERCFGSLSGKKSKRLGQTVELDKDTARIGMHGLVHLSPRMIGNTMVSLSIEETSQTFTSLEKKI